MTKHFDDQVVIVTGAGDGLGRCHALAFAEQGARVVVNDLGHEVEAELRPSPASLAVVDEIRSRGGEAIAEPADVANADQFEALTERVMERWGRIDVLVCNAGILQDRSFGKMTLEDFRRVMDVHLVGAFICIKAVWDIMKSRKYGRILLTTSASGLLGNFGQANYGAAKAGLVGLMNTLHIEGEKYDIRVNCLAPTAITNMTEGLLDNDAIGLLQPELVSPAALYLTAENAPSKTVLGAGAGVFSQFHCMESRGEYIAQEFRTPEGLAGSIEAIADLKDYQPLSSAFDQTNKFVQIARQKG